MSKRRLLPILSLAGLSLLLSGFTPFTRVTNVCPACPKLQTDMLTLTNGFKVAANVVAQNEAFYVMERFGEYRAVMKSAVAQVVWKDQGGPAALGTGDQILLKNGVVLHGAITAERPGLYFKIQVGALTHVAWNSQIDSVYKGGTRYTLPPAQ